MNDNLTEYIREAMKISTSIDSVCFLSLPWGINQECALSFMYICYDIFYDMWKLETALVSKTQNSVIVWDTHMIEYNVLENMFQNKNA